MPIIRSDPELFTLALPANAVEASFRATFAIPTGKWESGTWTVVGACPAARCIASKRIGAHVLQVANLSVSGQEYTAQAPLSEATLHAMNALAGSAYVAEMTDVFSGPMPAGLLNEITSWTLTLTQSADTDDTVLFNENETVETAAFLERLLQHRFRADDSGHRLTVIYDPAHRP